MKLLSPSICLLLFTPCFFSNVITAQQPSDSIPGVHTFKLEEYTEFLQTQNTSPKDYVFSLFEHSDIVILGERDHRDTTQYVLFLDIISDSRFIEDIGHVYTEVGVVNMTPEANRFIKGNYSTEDEFREAFRDYYRYEDFNPLWEKYNRYQFLKGLYDINSCLPESKKITLGLTDMEFSWKGMTPKKYRDFSNDMNQSWSHRDSIMAYNFMNLYEKQEPVKGKRKALLITSKPHAENSRLFFNIKGVSNEFRRVGSYIKEVYEDNCKIVAMNFYRADNYMGLPVGLSAFGLWDAAFELTGNNPVGFDLKDNIFGLTTSDCVSFLKWEDLFDGYIFYIPFYDFVLVMGVPYVVDRKFSKELIHRAICYEYGEGRNLKANTLRVFGLFARPWLRKYYGEVRLGGSFSILYEEFEEVLNKN